MEGEPARKRAAADAQKAKLEALERKLGITPAGAGDASGSGSAPEPLAGKKHRFDDTEYLEQSREIVDSVKSAVTAGTSIDRIYLRPLAHACWGRSAEEAEEGEEEPHGGHGGGRG